jgi:hypothetical protein
MRSPRWLAGLVACAGLLLTAFPQALSAAGRRDAAVTLKHKCVYIKAEHAAEELKTHLGAAPAGAKGARLTLTVDEATNTVLVRGPAGLIAKARFLLKELDVGRDPPSPNDGPVLQRHTVPEGRAESLAKILRDVYPADQTPKIAAIDPSTIILWARREDQGAIGHCLHTLQRVGRRDDAVRVARALLVGPKPLLQTHPVPPGQAEPLAQLLQKVYKDDPLTHVTASGPASIMVWTVPEWHQAIARYLKNEWHQAIARYLKKLPRLPTKVVPLKTLKPSPTAALLNAMSRGGPPFVEADEKRKALRVTGTKKQFAEVRTTLLTLGDGEATPAGGMRVFTLPEGSAAALAEALQKMVEKMRRGIKGQPVLPAPALPPPPLPKTPYLERYTIPSGQAEPVARILHGLHPDARDLKIAAVHPSTLAVWARGETQQAIDRRVQMLTGLVRYDVAAGEPPVGLGPRLALYPVPPGHAEALAHILQKVYKGDPVTGIAVFASGSLAVWAVPEWQQAIGSYLKRLPAPGK